MTVISCHHTRHATPISSNYRNLEGRERERCFCLNYLEFWQYETPKQPFLHTHTHTHHPPIWVHAAHTVAISWRACVEHLVSTNRAFSTTTFLHYIVYVELLLRRLIVAIRGIHQNVILGGEEDSNMRRYLRITRDVCIPSFCTIERVQSISLVFKKQVHSTAIQACVAPTLARSLIHSPFFISLKESMHWM